MKFRPLYIALVLLLFAVSCKGPKLIPRKELTQIVGEMLVRDQQIRGNRTLRHMGDTTYVYEGIFEKYGYTTDDYLYSIEHYLRDPERFSRVFRDVAANMEKEKARVEKEIVARDWFLKYASVPYIPVDSLFNMLYPDSLQVGTAHAAQHPKTGEVRFMPEEDDSLFLATDFSPLLQYLKEHEADDVEIPLITLSQ